PAVAHRTARAAPIAPPPSTAIISYEPTPALRLTGVCPGDELTPPTGHFGRVQAYIDRRWDDGDADEVVSAGRSSSKRRGASGRAGGRAPADAVMNAMTACGS